MKNEYLFNIRISNDEEIEYGEPLYLVTINPVSHWEKTGYCADHYTDEEWDDLTPVFDELGMDELMESTYECETDPEVLRKQLLDAGFCEDEDFNSFMERCF